MLTTLYDGRCIICQTTKRTITTLDWFSRVEFLDIHDDSITTRFPQFDHDTLMGQMHVIDAKGGVFAGFDGVRRLLREVPLGLPFWLILFLPGMNWLGPKIYRQIATNRYGINRLFGVDLDDGCEDGICRL